MTPQEFKNKLTRAKIEINQFIDNTAPRLVGKMAVDHFQNNFRQGGFIDNGINKWKAPNRFNETGSTSQKYGTLLSSTNELMNSITYRAGVGMVTISSDKVYAKIHNEGGVINIPVTEKMKKFAEAIGDDKKAESKWKGLALTKKTSLHVNMPKRQFIGNSSELELKIKNTLEKHILNLFK